MANSKDQAPEQTAQPAVQPDAQPVFIVPASAAVPPPPAQRPDEVPWEGGGGRYLVNGVLVDHEGRPLNKDGSLKKDNA